MGLEPTRPFRAPHPECGASTIPPLAGIGYAGLGPARLSAGEFKAPASSSSANIRYSYLVGGTRTHTPLRAQASQTRASTNSATTRCRVTDGPRTRNLGIHIPGLHQLSYGHHKGRLCFREDCPVTGRQPAYRCISIDDNIGNAIASQARACRAW